MNISQAISKRVMLLCYEKDMTVYELSKRSGVPKTTIKDIISGRSKNPRIISIEKLANGFSMSIRYNKQNHYNTDRKGCNNGYGLEV